MRIITSTFAFLSDALPTTFSIYCQQKHSVHKLQQVGDECFQQQHFSHVKKGTACTSSGGCVSRRAAIFD
jgi:hypothetical protein